MAEGLIDYRDIKLKPNQVQAVEMFARGETYSSISKAVGVSNTTLQAWKKNPEFEKALMLAQNQVTAMQLQNMDGYVNTLECKALSTLERMLESESDTVRLRAAQTILSHRNGRKASADGDIMVSFENMPIPGEPERRIDVVVSGQ